LNKRLVFTTISHAVKTKSASTDKRLISKVSRDKFKRSYEPFRWSIKFCDRKFDDDNMTTVMMTTNTRRDLYQWITKTVPSERLLRRASNFTRTRWGRAPASDVESDPVRMWEY